MPTWEPEPAIQALYFGEADICLEDFLLNSARFEFVRPSHAYWMDPLYYILGSTYPKAYDFSTKIEDAYHTFDMAFWILLLLTLIMLPGIIRLFKRAFRRMAPTEVRSERLPFMARQARFHRSFRHQTDDTSLEMTRVNQSSDSRIDLTIDWINAASGSLALVRMRKYREMNQCFSKRKLSDSRNQANTFQSRIKQQNRDTANGYIAFLKDAFKILTIIVSPQSKHNTLLEMPEIY